MREFHLGDWHIYKQGPTSVSGFAEGHGMMTDTRIMFRMQKWIRCAGWV